MLDNIVNGDPRSIHTHFSLIQLSLFFCCCCFCFCFLGPYPWHMGVPRLGVEVELQLPATDPATATQDPNHICNLHHSSQQHWFLNPLRRARASSWMLVGFISAEPWWELPVSGLNRLYVQRFYLIDTRKVKWLSCWMLNSRMSKLLTSFNMITFS